MRVRMMARLRARSIPSQPWSRSRGDQRGQHVLPRRFLEFPADLGQPDVAHLVAGDDLGAGDQAECPVAGHFLQVGAGSLPLPPATPPRRAPLRDDDQVHGVSADIPAITSSLDEVLHRSGLPRDMPAFERRIPGGGSAPVDVMTGVEGHPSDHGAARHRARPPSRVRTPRGGVRAGSSRIARTARHVSSGTSGSHGPPRRSPPVNRQPRDTGVEQDRADTRRSTPAATELAAARGRPLAHDPADSPPAQQRLARICHRRALAG